MEHAYYTSSSDPIVVDWGGLRSSKAKAVVEDAFSRLGERLEVREGMWDSLIAGESQAFSKRFIVVTDLYSCASAFKDVPSLRWTSAIRSARPYILALVRNKLDQRCAAWVDDIVLASEHRIMVCDLKESQAKYMEYLTSCLGRALAGTDPQSVIDVRFGEPEQALWLEFGDGFKASLEWDRLNLADVQPALVPETAAVGDDLVTIQVLREDGTIFEIDATAVRALVDKNLRGRLEGKAAASSETVGTRLREKREEADLTQAALAERSGLEQPLISKLERGRHRPRFDTLSKYAQGLGLSVSDLLS